MIFFFLLHMLTTAYGKVPVRVFGEAKSLDQIRFTPVLKVDPKNPQIVNGSLYCQTGYALVTPDKKQRVDKVAFPLSDNRIQKFVYQSQTRWERLIAKIQYHHNRSKAYASEHISSMSMSYLLHITAPCPVHHVPSTA